MDVRGLVLFLGCLACAFAAPLSSSTQCDTKCIVPSGFKEGRTYVYSYSTKTSTYIQGEQYGYSNLTVSCEARLEIIGTCEIVLELSEISVEETDRNGNTITSPNEDAFRNHLTRNRLRFAMQAGKVTSVCPSSDEAVWATNFKRGLLSSLQLTLPDSVPGSEIVMESTVSGTCQTEVTAEDSERVSKMKDFSLCEDRFNAVPWLMYGIKLVPQAPTSSVMLSEQHCRQEHNSGNYVTFSECEEVHILRPVSDQENGPATFVRQTLEYNRIIKAPSNHQLEGIEERKSIIFEHHKHMEESRMDDSAANDLVSQLCESLSGGVDSDTAKLYPALISEMRRLESSTLAGVLATATCDGYQTTLQQVLRDALGECKSSGCIEIMVNLIQDGTIQDQTVIRKWIRALNTVHHPTKEMVSHLMQLAEEDSIRTPLFLAVSSIINKYCTVINPNCEGETEISTALDHFEALLGIKCRYQDKEDKRKMMITIHALGNAGIFSRSLRKCFESESTDMSLRIAAIQAASQVSCEGQNAKLPNGRLQKSQQQQRDSLIAILEKSSQDSELRITAYKALMVCPSQDILDVLDNLLSREKSNQVGGYIVSHLKNIQASQDPLKANHRALLEDHPITAQFLDDPMKFSKNFELSWYNETTGNGLAGEADVIFSSNSFIPRQISLKGQVDALGYAFEAFELGGRVEGLHGLLESAFGPLSSYMGEDEETRKKRSLIKDNKLENIIEDFEVDGDSGADGSIYLKIFGRELMFMDAEDIKAWLVPKGTNEYMMEVAMLAMGQTYETSKTSLLMESSVSLPLANGLELKFSINGSTTDRLKASGKLDIMGMVMKPRSMEIDGTLEPSSAVDVSCLMEVDAHCARIGVNYEVSGHTATSLSGKISVEEGKNIQLKLRALEPEQKQELITISSKVSFLHQEELDIIPSSSLELTEEKICTGEFLENAIGMKICGESHYHETPEGENPLSGAYQFSLTAEKVEDDLESYDIEVSYHLKKEMVDGEQHNTDVVHFYFGTPNTQKHRSYGFDFQLQRATKQFTADFICPYIDTVHLVGNRISDDDHKRLDMTITTSNGAEYSLYFNFEKTESDSGNNFYPTFRIRTPKFGTLEFVGSVIDTENLLSLDMSVAGESRQFVTINGETTKVRGSKKSQFDTNLAVGGEYVQGGIQSSIVMRDGVYIIDATLSKQTIFGEDRSVTISAKHKYSMMPFDHDFYMTCEFSHSPESNFRFDGDLEGTNLNSHSTVKFCYGQASCSSNKKIIISHNMDFQVEEQDVEGILSVSLEHPIQGTHLVLSQHTVSRHGHRNYTLSIIDEAQSVVMASVRLGAEYNSVGDSHQGSVELSLTTPESIKRLNQSWAKQESGEFTGVNIIQWQRDSLFLTTAGYSKDGDTMHNVDVQTIYPSGKVRHLHTHVDVTEDEITSQLVIYKDEEERFFMEATANRETTGDSGGSGSVRVRTPFHFLSDFLLGFQFNCHESAGFDTTLSFKQFPDEETYAVSVMHAKSTSETIEDKRSQVVLALPSSSFTLLGMVHQNEESNEKKAGVSLKVQTEEREKLFGIEGKVINHSDDQQTDIFFRVNTTAPYHQNAVELTVTNPENGFNLLLDIEYFAGKHVTTNVNVVKKTDGFVFKTIVNAPEQRAVLTLDHTFEVERLFNPHLSIGITSFDVDMTLLDVNLKLVQERTTNGKNFKLHLVMSGPGKTLYFTTGIDRSENGFNYLIEVGNEDEVRLRIDLNTTVHVEEEFNANIELSATSIYAPQWPVKCGMRLEQQSVDHTGVVIYFNVNEEPLFHFNISKNARDNLPGINHKDEVMVIVELPTSINPNLHKFGMHFGKEDRTTQDGLPEKAGSLSFFWGPESNQQLTVSSASSVERSSGTMQVDGSLVFVQPLRTTHLQPEYSLDYSVTKLGPNVDFTLHFNHGNGEVSTLEISHSEEMIDDNPNYLTSVTAAAKGGKRFQVSSDVTPVSGGQFDSNFVFTMDDGDYHEQAELGINLKKHSQVNLESALEITFEHSPSGMDLTSFTSIRNSDRLMYFGIEGECTIPTLDSPLNLGFETELDKTTKMLMVHALGPANDIIVRGTVRKLTEGEKVSYRLETNNEINGEQKTLNIQIDHENRDVDLIVETGEVERTIRFGYLNDSSVQVTLNKDDHENAQTTLTVLNPHTLYTLITWDTAWPGAFKEAARERIEMVKEKFWEDVEIYREIGQTISEGFETYMTSALMRNQDILEKMQEIKEGLKERLTEIKENYQEQRRTIKSKFVAFREEARENLTPLIEEYKEMNIQGGSQINKVLDHIKDEVTSYFEGALRALNSYQMSVGGSLLGHILDVMDSVEENIQKDQEMWEDYKAGREMRMERRREEIALMAASWQAAKQRFLTKWHEFTDIMSETINEEVFADMKLGFQLNPAFSDSSRIASEIMEVVGDISSELERISAENEQRRQLRKNDMQALRNMRIHFRAVRTVPSIGIKLCNGAILRNLIDNIKSTLKEKMEELIQWVIEENQGYKLLYDMEEGRIEIWLYMDQRYDDLISPPVNDPLGNLQVALGRLAEDFPLLDDMRKYKSQLYENMDLVMAYLEDVAMPAHDEMMGETNGVNLEDLWGWKAMINTFFYEMFSTHCMKGRAFLVGDQHYKTFDGSYYGFAGKCSFLLAQDFVDNTFTVAVEYNRDENEMSRSFVVIADGVTIELHGNRVFIGRNEVELPYAVSDAVSITRDANNIYVIGKKGFTVTYNLRWDIFNVELGILYFGKTAGLFGNFNHEPNDDFVDSNGDIRPHVDEFARSWEIGKKCPSHLNKASTCDVSPSLAQNYICAEVFLDGLGPASNGHPAVNPEPYYTMCANISCRGLSSEDFGAQLCGIFQAYTQECKSKGLTWIEMPKECNYCPVSEDEYVPYYGSTIDVPRGSDVVIVVEQESCMAERSQQIIDLMDRVNTELKREGYRDNRFGVVGFGGAGIHKSAHAETINGELFGPAQGLLRSLRGMPFDGEGMSDAWEAISFAMNYPFRGGVSKHIIFMACSDCLERSRAAGSLRIQKAMNDLDIKFTMVMDYTFNLGEKSAKEDDEIFGIDTIGVYTDKLAGIDVGYFKGDPGLLHFVNQPNNPCTRLALATEGALFSTDSIGTKKFKDVFALWIVKHSFTEERAWCTCVEQSSGFVQSICE